MAKQDKETIQTADAKAIPAEADDKFTKAQILASAAFANRRDLLTVLLEDEREYTTAEVNKVMDDWLGKGVE